MRKEFGKWLMDVAKYIATAVILSTIFSDMQGTSLFIISFGGVLLALLWGLYLVREPAKTKKRKTKCKKIAKKNKKRSMQAIEMS